MTRSIATVMLAGLMLCAHAAEAQQPPRITQLRRGIRWAKDLDDALERAGRDDAPVLVFVTLSNDAASLRYEEAMLSNRRFRALANLYVSARVDGRRDRDALAKYGVQKAPALLLLNSAGKKVYVLDARTTPKAAVTYLARAFILSMYESAVRLKDAGHVRRASRKFKWIMAYAPDTPPDKWSKHQMERIAADGIKKLSQAAIAKDAGDLLKMMTLLDELEYEYYAVPAGESAKRAIVVLRTRPQTAKALDEVYRRQNAERKLRWALALDAKQDAAGALIVCWDVTRDYPGTPAAEQAADRAKQLEERHPELVAPAKQTREKRDCQQWSDMAKAFEANKRPDKALAYWNLIIKYYPDTPAAEEAQAAQKRRAP